MLPPTDLRSCEAPMTATGCSRKRGSNEEGIRRGVQLLAVSYQLKHSKELAATVEAENPQP
jgi:hypothetical protein